MAKKGGQKIDFAAELTDILPCNQPSAAICINHRSGGKKQP
jgi:hypothetical protein